MKKFLKVIGTIVGTVLAGTLLGYLGMEPTIAGICAVLVSVAYSEYKKSKAVSF